MNERGSGPLTDVKIFRGFEQEIGAGVSSGNTLIVLGREEEARRSADSFENYFEERPELSFGLLTNKELFDGEL